MKHRKKSDYSYWEWVSGEGLKTDSYTFLTWQTFKRRRAEQQKERLRRASRWRIKVFFSLKYHLLFLKNIHSHIRSAKQPLQLINVTTATMDRKQCARTRHRLCEVGEDQSYLSLPDFPLQPFISSNPKKVMPLSPGETWLFTRTHKQRRLSGETRSSSTGVNPNVTGKMFVTDMFG